MRISLKQVSVVLVVLMVSACGAPKPAADAGVDAGHTGGGAGGGTGGAVGGGTGGGTQDAGPTLGSSCTAPLPMVQGTTGVTGKINTAGKKLYYALPVTKDDFLVIATNANPNDDPDKLDTAVTVYDATGATRLASDDDAFPRLSTDSELFFQAPATGTVCLKVEDWSTWAGQTPVARPNDTFKLTAGKLSPTAASVSFDTESNDLASNAQVGHLAAFNSIPGGFSTVAGSLSSAADVDVYKFTAPDGGTNLTVYFPPNGVPSAAGVNGYGSTLPRIAAQVTTVDGLTVLARLAPPSDVSKMSDSMSAVVSPGDVLVWVQRPSGQAAGSNDFYATSVEIGGDSPAEAEAANTSGTNDTAATAEALGQSVSSSDPKTKQSYILGFQPANDVDYFSFQAGANDTVALACGSARSGSGLVGATFEILGSSTASDGGVADGSSLQSETETDSADVYWGDGSSASKAGLTITTAGTYFLKVTHASQDATNTGTFYRCGLYVTSP